jgi:ParB-like nuclease domain
MRVAVTWVETREVPVQQLTRYPGNARRGNIDEIRASVRRHGQYRAVVARDTGKNGLIVLAGNHTTDALEAEGHKTVRCEIITCTDQEAKRIVVADNKLSDLAGNDNSLLAQLLADIGEDLGGTGYHDAEVTEIMRVGGFLADEASSFLDDLTFPPPRPAEMGGIDDDGGNQDSEYPPEGQNGQNGQNSQNGQAPADWVPVQWMVTAQQRATIYQAVFDAKQRWDLGTTAEAITAIASSYLLSSPTQEAAR